MRKNICLLVMTLFLTSTASFAFELSNPFNKENKKDARQKEAEYIHNVLKQEEAEKYGRRKFNYKPSGYMTVEEYEAISQYKDKAEDKIEIPKTPKGSDMKYVPEPTYKIVRYNDPPGSPELTISKTFYKLRQYNGQGITSPDFSIMVYPAVYYYPNSASTAADLFVIPLDEIGTPLTKIMKANVVKRIETPILSTEKSIDNSDAFRTLTPIDFSPDGKRLLAKEKIGSTQDGIWKTNAIVYDFGTKMSYNLVELRDAIIYYWKTNKGLDLDDSMWDIYPLGFSKDDANRVIASAYAFTGKKPIFLGVWSVDVKGEQSRLLSFSQDSAQVSINGFKIIQDGVVKKVIIEKQEEAMKKVEEANAKAAKKKKEKFEKQIDKELKVRLKEMDKAFKESQKDFNKQVKMGGTTSLNDNPEKFKEWKIKDLEKDIQKTEKKLQKQQKSLEKLNESLSK